MNGLTNKFTIGQLSEYLDQPIEKLDLLKENKYCYIFKATAEQDPFIIKQYKGNDPALITAESQALDFYHEITKDDDDLIDSGTIKLLKDKNLLSIRYVEGEPFNELLYSSRNKPIIQQRCIRIMRILGNFLHRLYNLTVSAETEPSPFLFEYSNYCADKLENMPIFGRTLFRNFSKQTEELALDFRNANVPISFIHGDFVFLNIHVSGEKVGLIDLANTNPHSHLLNDLYNLRLALDNMLLPQSLKKLMLEALYDGLGDLTFPEIAHRFYYEYHRRRWLMLKLGTLHPKHLIQGLRGVTSFARPFNSDQMKCL